MPYIQCKKRKGWSKVSSDVCFQIDNGKPCPYLEVTDKSEKELDIKCTYKSESAQVKKVIKGKKNEKDRNILLNRRS